MGRRGALGGALILGWLTLLTAGVAAAAPAAAGATPPALPVAQQSAPAAMGTFLTEEQLRALDTGPLDAVLTEVNQTWQGYAPELSLRQILALYAGEGQAWRPEVLGKGLMHYFFREVMANSGLLAKLVVLAVVAAVLQNLESALHQEKSSRLAQTVVYLVMATLVLGGFGLALATAREAIRSLQDFMVALLPAATAVLISLGGTTSAALVSPIMLAASSWIGSLMAVVVFPLAFFSAVLEIASGASEHLKLTNLAALMRYAALSVLGLAFTLFLGLTYVKAAAAGVADTVALRTAKFMVGAFVPVVGKMFADAAELVWSSGHLLKSALGLVGLLAVFLIAVFPALKILSLVVIYRAAAALIQPVGQSMVANGLNAMAGALTLVFAAVATVALMFFIGITVLVGASTPGVLR